MAWAGGAPAQSGSASLTGRGHEREPLGAYALFAAAFLALSAVSAGAALRRGALRAPVPLSDLALLGLGTARLSRLMTREKVAEPLRAPFTDRAPDRAERPRGRGLTRALGELLTCPRCFGMWASSALSLGYAFAPRAARMAALILASSLLSDWTNAQHPEARG